MSVTTIPPRLAVRRRDRAGRGRRHVGFLQGGPITYVILAIVAVVSIFPIYWTVVAASTSNSAIA